MITGGTSYNLGNFHNIYIYILCVCVFIYIYIYIYIYIQYFIVSIYSYSFQTASRLRHLGQVGLRPKTHLLSHAGRGKMTIFHMT